MEKPRILIIEDDKRWRDRLKLILEGEGYSVSTASNFMEARDILDRQSFDLVTVDIKLDHSEGMGSKEDIGPEWEMLLNLIGRSRGIVISGYATPKRVRDAFKRHGAIDFIEKAAFDLREFRDTVRLVLAEKVVSPSALAPVNGAEELTSEVAPGLPVGDAIPAVDGLWKDAWGPMSLEEERTWLERELGGLKRTLYKLRAQRAIYAPGEVPLRLLNQIEELEEEAQRIEKRLRELEQLDQRSY